MSAEAGIAQRWPRALRPIVNRPHLVGAIVVGSIAYFVAAHWVSRDITRALVGWDCGVLVFIGLCLNSMRDCDCDRLKQRAIAHDEGRHLMLLLTTFAAVASVGALVAELSAAKGQPGGGFRVALAASTVVLSWLFVQFVFAIHYAHIYYLAEDADQGADAQHRGGLEFGDDAEPDYWDFLHFSMVMGATAQTADIIIRSKEIRRAGTIHTLIAFGFNTAILATMINLAANLF
jgi:uncharacterized membrane protein